ncbi:hypothetical protein PBY51_018690 [Eleginops maclovinus]|uniref:Uncharacterized protein n=1 Tax=Eleginops maclovinus TaxID=56733 RepID=A0AAN7Y8B6_ELEMC|nr:hypothetical protein PBY51_018690 [Eleginops maclovinus]
MPLHQPLPAPQGEVLSGWPLLFLSPPGSRLPVTSYILLIPDPQRSLSPCRHPFLLSTHMPCCDSRPTCQWSGQPTPPCPSLLLLEVIESDCTAYL